MTVLFIHLFIMDKKYFYEEEGGGANYSGKFAKEESLPILLFPAIIDDVIKR